MGLMKCLEPFFNFSEIHAVLLFCIFFPAPTPSLLITVTAGEFLAFQRMVPLTKQLIVPLTKQKIAGSTTCTETARGALISYMALLVLFPWSKGGRAAATGEQLLVAQSLGRAGRQGCWLC